VELTEPVLCFAGIQPIGLQSNERPCSTAGSSNVEGLQEVKLLDLPQFERFRDERNVKVLRHKDLRHDLWALREQREFERYQNGQTWDVFGRAQYVVSLIAERNRYAKFVGVWEVLAKRKKKVKGFLYRTKELRGFEDLEGRLIVRWGEGTRSWSQWLHRQGNKEIVEILPPNSVTDFPGYYDIHLPYAELREMIDHPDSNREWQRMLSSVSGVYLIVDQVSGNQYVGSAYGIGGVWSRWKSYAKSPSGGNKRLKDLLMKHPGREKSFQFSIMRVLEPGTMRAYVLDHEALVKRKLGCRAFGLNAN